VLVRLLRFYAHPPKIFGGEGLRKSHEGASSPLQERRRFQTKGFAKATKIPSKNALHSLLHHRVIVAAFNISRMRFAERFTTTRFHARMRCILCCTIDRKVPAAFNISSLSSYQVFNYKLTRVSLPRRPSFSAPSSYQDTSMRYIDQDLLRASLPLIELPYGRRFP